MINREITCIGCPMGCSLEVHIDENDVISVKGNTCKRGEEYGKKECTNPTRIVTSSVIVDGGELEVVPVKTKQDVPKGKIFEIVKELKKVKLNAPVYIGDIVVSNILDTGVDIVATQKVLKSRG